MKLCRLLTSMLVLGAASPSVLASDNIATAGDLLNMGNAWQEVSTSASGFSHDPHAAEKASTYIGYVQGVGEATVGTFWCAKPNMKIRDVGSAVLVELRAESAQKDQPALDAVRRALQKQLPCARS